MATTRAKFMCVSIKKYQSMIWFQGKPQATIEYEYEFIAVTGGSEENDKFFAATPSGSIKLSAVRNDLFEPGQSYYLDFRPEDEL